MKTIFSLPRWPIVVGFSSSLLIAFVASSVAVDNLWYSVIGGLFFGSLFVEVVLYFAVEDFEFYDYPSFYHLICGAIGITSYFFCANSGLGFENSSLGYEKAIPAFFFSYFATNLVLLTCPKEPFTRFIAFLFTVCGSSVALCFLGALLLTAANARLALLQAAFSCVIIGLGIYPMCVVYFSSVKVQKSNSIRKLDSRENDLLQRSMNLDFTAITYLDALLGQQYSGVPVKHEFAMGLLTSSDLLNRTIVKKAVVSIHLWLLELNGISENYTNNEIEPHREILIARWSEIRQLRKELFQENPERRAIYVNLRKIQQKIVFNVLLLINSFLGSGFFIYVVAIFIIYQWQKNDQEILDRYINIFGTGSSFLQWLPVSFIGITIYLWKNLDRLKKQLSQEFSDLNRIDQTLIVQSAERTLQQSTVQPAVQPAAQPAIAEAVQQPIVQPVVESEVE
jgi:hypothetical protein